MSFRPSSLVSGVPGRLFAGIGLVLVGIGTYSVISYTVSQQSHEIGIRMALGANGSQVFRMVVRRSGLVVAVGIATGIVASLVANRLIASQLWGVKPHDVVTLVSVATIVSAVGLFACSVPAQRATRVDPAVSLRCEF